MTPEFPDTTHLNSQTALLDVFFPGFSLLSSALYKYSKIDLSLYIPTLLALGLLIFASQYVKTWIWTFMNRHLMSTADIRVDDEMYNMMMGWIANQQFAKQSRRFVANTNLNSRLWFLFREFNDDGNDDESGIEFDEDLNPIPANKGKKDKSIRFTPSFGTHYFWYKKRLFIFSRQEDVRHSGWGSISEREQISVSSFGRDPTMLKKLLDECRSSFIKNDENRTVIYRGGLKSGTAEPTWTRCVSRVSRPFSTVVLDESVKKSLLDDMRDYLTPSTRRWYSNRGIPYRRGYLFYGPAGSGKTSISYALAGYFRLAIYIVSLNSLAMNEENLGILFSELPKQCLVLLEDIDTAGLTHTRDNSTTEEPKPIITVTAASPKAPAPTSTSTGRISLSALLNILDGVASQEGRILIMTTNYIDKLDEALIRPGRIDMTIKFDLANRSMIKTIFCSIYATLEGDLPPSAKTSTLPPIRSLVSSSTSRDSKLRQAQEAKKIAEAETTKSLALARIEEEKLCRLGEEIAELIPSMIFSPAEIQGFFLKHKRAPEAAVKEAGKWVEEMMAQKQKRLEKERLEALKREEDEKKAEEQKNTEEEKKEVKE